MALSTAEYSRRWRARNPEKVKADNEARKKRLCRRNENRWAMILHHVKRRCNYKRRGKSTYYTEYGIQCRLTMIEVARLWFRDKAWAQRAPHLDRIDPDQGYFYDNCRFIEAEENLARIRRGEREPGEEG